LTSCYPISIDSEENNYKRVILHTLSFLFLSKIFKYLISKNYELLVREIQNGLQKETNQLVDKLDDKLDYGKGWHLIIIFL
jgi:hypothetical protein